MAERVIRIADWDKYNVAPSEEPRPHPSEEDLLYPDMFPRMGNISVGVMVRAVIRPAGPRLPTEYVYVRTESARKLYPIAMWNLNWETAQVRGRARKLVMSLPKELRPIVKLRDDINVTFVPLERGHRYQAYAPLFHLLPRKTLERYGLPLIPSGIWPSMFVSGEHQISSDFDDRLARAFAAHIWPCLSSGSRIDAFSKDDPLRLLAHSLDFWLGPITELIQDWMSQFGRARADRAEARLIAKARADIEPGLLVNRPQAQQDQGQVRGADGHDARARAGVRGRRQDHVREFPRAPRPARARSRRAAAQRRHQDRRHRRQARLRQPLANLEEAAED